MMTIKHEDHCACGGSGVHCKGRACVAFVCQKLGTKSDDWWLGGQWVEGKLLYAWQDTVARLVVDEICLR